MSRAVNDLAGLGFSFEAVQLHKPNSTQRGGGRGSSAAVVPPPPPPPPNAPGVVITCDSERGPQPSQGRASTGKVLSFDLRSRRPGPAYGSPGDSPQQQQDAAPPECSGSRAAPLQPGTAAGLAHLKLASLARRGTQGSSGGSDSGNSSRPSSAAHGLRPPRHATAAAPAAEEQHQRQPVQHLPPLQFVSAEPPPAGRCTRELEEPPQPANDDYQIPAFRPPAAPCCASGSCEPSALSVDAAGPALPGRCTGVEDGDGPRSSGSVSDGSDDPECVGPATLEEALHCLDLLPAAAAVARPPVSAATAPPPHWLRVRATALVLAARRQAAIEAVLLPLVRRLRQVRMHIEYHKVRWC